MPADIPLATATFDQTANRMCTHTRKTTQAILGYQQRSNWGTHSPRWSRRNCATCLLYQQKARRCWNSLPNGWKGLSCPNICYLMVESLSVSSHGTALNKILCNPLTLEVPNSVWKVGTMAFAIIWIWDHHIHPNSRKGSSYCWFAVKFSCRRQLEHYW